MMNPRTFTSFDYFFFCCRMKPFKKFFCLNLRLAGIILVLITIAFDLFLSIKALIEIPLSLSFGWSLQIMFRVIFFLIFLYTMIFNKSF